MTVDRRWEFEILSRMKEKLLYKVEKSVNTTVKKIGVGYQSFFKVGLLRQQFVHQFSLQICSVQIQQELSARRLGVWVYMGDVCLSPM